MNGSSEWITRTGDHCRTPNTFSSPRRHLRVTHDEGAVHALSPDKVILLPDGTEDSWSEDFADLVSLA